MKKTFLVLTAIGAILLSGCNSATSTSSPKNSINKFETDTNTYRIEDLNKSNTSVQSNTSSTTSEESDYVMPEHYRQLILNGDDLSINFTINGNDIYYNNCQYVGLYSVVKGINFPYNKVTVINFLIKSFNPVGNKIICTGYDEEQVGVGTGESIHNTLSVSKNYLTIAEKYKSNAHWNIFMYEADTNGKSAALYGTKDYIINEGQKELKIDMSALNKLATEDTKDEETLEKIAHINDEETEGNENGNSGEESGTESTESGAESDQISEGNTIN